MNATRFPFVSALLVTLLTTAALPALATTATFNGNGQTGFVGAVSSGTLTVADDGNGGIDFTFALGNGQVNLGGNDLVIYLDNSKGGGIGTSTSGLNDSGDGAREAVSEYTATGDGVRRGSLDHGRGQ